MRLKRVMGLLVLLCGFQSISAYGQVVATWTGGSGNWSNATNWSSNPSAPINSGDSATITTPGSSVTYDIPSTVIENLTVGTTASLSINPADYLQVESTVNSGMFTNNGYLSVASSGSGFSNYGTVLNAPGATFEQSWILYNYGGFTNSGQFKMDATFYNYGTFTNYGNIPLYTFKGDVENHGAFTNYGTFNDCCGSINYAGGTITNYGVIVNSVFGLSNNGVLNNYGTITNSNGTLTGLAEPTLFNSGTLNSTGSINNTGTIDNVSGAYLNDYGTLNNTLGANLNNAGMLTNSGTLYNDSTSTFTNSGTVNNISGGNITDYGTLSNAGTLNNTSGANLTEFGTLSNSGTLNNTSGANITIFGTLSNSGTINNTSGANFTNFGTLTTGGTINNGGAFTNSGAVTISNWGLFTTSTNYTQTAGSTLVNGTLTATGSAIVNIQGGTLGGAGTINGNVAMGGTLTPGAPGTPGTLTIVGNYEQIGNGTLEELIGPVSSSLNVIGGVALDSGASLDIALLNGYDPLGQTFDIMNYSSLVGQFSNGSSFWEDGFLWDVSYGQNQIDVKAVQMPEPSSFSMLLIGLAALAFCAHRRKIKTQHLS